MDLGRFIEQWVRDAWKASGPAFPLKSIVQRISLVEELMVKQSHLDFQGCGLERGHLDPAEWVRPTRNMTNAVFVQCAVEER
jgi:hypothetical protein